MCASAIIAYIHTLVQMTSRMSTKIENAVLKNAARKSRTNNVRVENAGLKTVGPENAAPGNAGSGKCKTVRPCPFVSVLRSQEWGTAIPCAALR